MTTKFNPDYCPKCGLLCDAVSDPEGSDSKPQQGDISICFGCAAILEFDKNLKLKVCSEDKINKLDTETLVQLVKIRSYILGKDLK